MMHLKIDRSKFIILLSIYFGIRIAVCDKTSIDRPGSLGASEAEFRNNPLSTGESTKSPLSARKEAILLGNEAKAEPNNPQKVEEEKKVGPEDITSKVPPVDVTGKTTETTIQSLPGPPKSLNSAALLRGFYVFVGLSVLVVAYIVFRSLRLNKTQAQMVRKYGVLAHRQDVEMRPLPLEEEDDDDTTVFDASNVSAHDPLRQNT